MHNENASSGEPDPAGQPSGLGPDAALVVFDGPVRHLVANVEDEVSLRGLSRVHWVRVRDQLDQPEGLAADGEADWAQRLGIGLDGSPATTNESLDHHHLMRRVVDLADHAGLVISQHHDESRSYETLVSSLSQSLAARSTVPHLVFPHFWSADLVKHEVVVVGVEDPDTAATLIRAAATEARRRGTALQVLHAGLTSRALRTVKEIFADDEAALADLQVSWTPVHGHVAEALGDATKTADMLVIGHHLSASVIEHLFPRLSHVASGALSKTTCPLLLVPVAPSVPS